jgi:iron complex outermembrane receptor protein
MQISTRLVFIALLIFSVHSSYSQSNKGSITGVVIDGNTKKVLQGANIKLLPGTHGATTNQHGEFQIKNIEAGSYTVTVSFMGYNPKSKKVNITKGQNLVISFSLATTYFELSEVIIKDWAQKHVPYVKSDLSKIEIEALGTRDLGDYLRSVPNVSAIRKGGTQLDPVVRGFKFDQLNVRIDGFLRIEGGCPNRMDPNVSHIEVDDIEKIEIIKGPYALKFGPAFGGFVNIVTSKPTPFETKKFEIHARGIKGYESNWNGTKDRINVKFGNNKVYFNLSGNSQNYGNYRDGNGNSVASEFRKYSFTGEMGFKPKKNHEFLASYVTSHGRDVKFPALPMDERIDDTWLLSGQYIIMKPTDKIKKIQIRVFESNVHHVMDTREKTISDTSLAVSTVDAIVKGISAGMGIKAGKGGTLIMGAGFEHTYKDGKRVKTMYKMPAEPILPTKTENLMDAVITNFGAASEYEKKFDASTFVASVRFDLNTATTNPIIVYKAGSSIVQDTITGVNSQFANFSFSLGYNKYLTENLTAGFAIGRGVRSPNMLERYVNLLPIGYDKYDYLGDPAIKPEANHQADLTFKYETEKLGRITINGFYSLITNYISAKELPPAQYLPNSTGVLGVKQFYNADLVTFKGFEFTYATPATRKLGGSIIASYTRATMSAAWKKLDKIENDALYEVPPFESTITIHYKLFSNKLVPRASIRLVAAQNYVSEAFDEEATPGFVLGNFGITYKHNEILSLSGGINNILNTAYYEHLSRRMIGSGSDFYEPGRVFYINMIVKI